MAVRIAKEIMSTHFSAALPTFHDLSGSRVHELKSPECDVPVRHMFKTKTFTSLYWTPFAIVSPFFGIPLSLSYLHYGHLRWGDESDGVLVQELILGYMNVLRLRT